MDSSFVMIHFWTECTASERMFRIASYFLYFVVINMHQQTARIGAVIGADGSFDFGRYGTLPHYPLFTAYIKYSAFPSCPVMGDGITPFISRPRPRTNLMILLTAASLAASSRTMPPFPTCSLPTSNCGFMSAIRSDWGFRNVKIDGITFSREMKETSTTIIPMESGTSRGSIWRIFVRSMTTTRWCCLSFHANWP